MLRVLINRYNPKAGNDLSKFLPVELAQAVAAQDIKATNLAPIIDQPQNSLARIHYSWLKPAMQQFPATLQPVAMAALTEEQMTGLKISLLPSISPVVKTFVLNKLYEHLQVREHFPVEYLPQTDLTPLAKWKKQHLMCLIDFLGLHDLASEVRHIVNRDHLKNVYACLTPKQFQYLKMCLHQKEQLVSPKLGIDPSKQDCVLLKKIIHKRGLLRLGRALNGQHADLVWHIAHILDIGRGQILLKEFQAEEKVRVTQILRQQVLGLMNFLKKSEV